MCVLYLLLCGDLTCVRQCFAQKAIAADLQEPGWHTIPCAAPVVQSSAPSPRHCTVLYPSVGAAVRHRCRPPARPPAASLFPPPLHSPPTQGHRHRHWHWQAARSRFRHFASGDTRQASDDRPCSDDLLETPPHSRPG